MPRKTFLSLRFSGSIPDVVSSDAQLVQVDGIPVLDRHLDALEVSVHGNVHTSDSAVNLNSFIYI